MNVIIEQRSKPKKEGGEGHWKAIGFYPTLEQAIASLLERVLRGAGATTLAELRREVISAKMTLYAAIRDAGGVSVWEE